MGGSESLFAWFACVGLSIEDLVLVGVHESLLVHSSCPLE